MLFRLVSKSTTLDDLESPLSTSMYNSRLTLRSRLLNSATGLDLQRITKCTVDPRPFAGRIGGTRWPDAAAGRQLGHRELHQTV